MASSPTDIALATLVPFVGLPLLAAKGFGGEGGNPTDGAPPLPPNATEADKAAHKAATEAKKRQRSSIQNSDGRGSTILTGGKLGELAEFSEKPKGLLGL